MADLSNRLTLEQLRETEEYQRLTQKQRLWVATYCEGGLADGKYDALNATRTAYACKDAESARVLSYSVTANPKILACLNRHFNRTPTEEFLMQLDRAIANKNLTIAQVEVLRLKCKMLGIENRLPVLKEANQGVIPPDVLKAEKEARRIGKKIPGPKPQEKADEFAF